VFDSSNLNGDGLFAGGYNSTLWGLQVAFLDEFRITMVYDNAHEFPVFDTLLPQDHPRNLRWFRLPWKYRGRGAYLHVDRGGSLRTVDRDGPLIVDPTQAIIIMDFLETSQEPRVYLILRIQPLIEYACSMRADVRIPWNEWGRGAVAMEIPSTVTVNPETVIHGARVLAIVETPHGLRQRFCIHTFDFSRRGSAALPLSDENDREAERNAAFEDGWRYVLEVADGMSPWGLQSAGGGVVLYIVSLFPYLIVDRAVG
jgi:hypothetical protein